jgi:hypothetical protein
VLCNVVYSNLSNVIDTVNVNTLTEFVMHKTTDTNNTAYDNWTTGAKDQYCNQLFAETFRSTASGLENEFNFLNTLFDANNTGFDVLLRGFSSEEFELDEPGAFFNIDNGLGSIVNYDEGRWIIEATGTAGSFSINTTREESAITITLADLKAFLEELIEAESAEGVTITSLTATLGGNGLGEINTTVTANVRGSASLSGASVVSRNFNIDVTVLRQAGEVGDPL